MRDFERAAALRSATIDLVAAGTSSPTRSGFARGIPRRGRRVGGGAGRDARRLGVRPRARGVGAVARGFGGGSRSIGARVRRRFGRRRARLGGEAVRVAVGRRGLRGGAILIPILILILTRRRRLARRLGRRLAHHHLALARRLRFRLGFSFSFPPARLGLGALLLPVVLFVLLLEVVRGEECGVERHLRHLREFLPERELHGLNLCPL